MAVGPVKKAKTILITGASRGLGAALAKRLSAPNVSLILWARNEDALEDVAKICRERGAITRIQTLDVADLESLKRNFDVAVAGHHLDCVVVNAGLFDGAREQNGLEDLTSEIVIIDVNLRAALALGNLAAQYMRDHGVRGQIAFISSIAATFPLADAAGYSASKAGISAYARAMREKLAADGITVTDIQPGHIKTDMTAHHEGALPQLMEIEDAANNVAAALEKRKVAAAFPFGLYLLAKLSGFLPWRVTAFLSRGQRFHITDRDRA